MKELKELLNKFELWFLRRTIAKIIVQGRHTERLIGLYTMIAEEVFYQFTEDNLPTTRGFLEECHKDALPLSIWVKCSGPRDCGIHFKNSVTS